MTTRTVEPQADDIESRPPRPRRFNVDEYMKMVEMGIFAEPRCHHVELMDGEILVMSPDSHPGCFTEETLAALPDPWYPSRFRFSVEEYMKMAEAGIFTENERVELLDGEIIEKTPAGNPHEANTSGSLRFLAPLFVEGRAVLRVQSHVLLDDNSRPEPDLALLKWREDLYRHRSPAPQDVLLLIEVSDSSLPYDRGTKLSRYAEAGIPEVWIENIPARSIEVYSNPVNGNYTTTRVYRPGDTIRPIAFPDVELPVSQFIGALSG